MNPQYKISVSNMCFHKKILPGDAIWPKFNSSFKNDQLETQQIIQIIYDGFPVTTWHKDHWRHSENYICGQHLGLDFDNGIVTLESLMKDPFVTKYGAFVYTTMSHTEENPRCRAMFLLDQPIMQAKNYALAASALLWMFGSADRACKDAVRFWYGSPECKFEYFDNVLPLEVIKRMIANYQETGQNEKRKAIDKNYHAPASQQEVSEALKFIQPWQIDYLEWVSVLMAIHSQFGDAGLGLAESWGDGKGDEIERKFKSFKEAGNTSGAITIATVFGIAKRYGWKKSVIQDGSFAV
jgi:hypothetical protein